jgi:hypothetical protein
MSKLLGGVLQAAGILIAGASGLCSLFFLVWAPPWSAGGMWVLMLIVPCGVVPALIGFVLYRWGRSVVRQAERDAADTFD